MEHFLNDHLSVVIVAGTTFLAVFLPASLDGLKTYQETKNLLPSFISFLTAFLSLQRWVKVGTPKPNNLDK